MNKFFISLLALLLLAACQKEEGFSPTQKRHTASKYLSYAEAVEIASEAASMLEGSSESRSTITRRVKSGGVTCRVKPLSRSEELDSLYYVVNYENEAGFALVAAKRHAPVQLLAVTEAGSYSAGEITENEGFNLYVETMEAAMARSGENPPFIRDTSAISNSWYEYEQENGPWYGVMPMINVRWGQGYVQKWNNSYNSLYPYNKYCISQTDSVSYAGCAVVAMAQIMSKHKKPSFYILDFDNQGQVKTLDWDAMVTWVGGPWYQWNATNADEIALWFRQIGDNASASYSPRGTGVATPQVRACLSDYGYASNAPTNYDYNKICNSLNAGRPVYIRGDRKLIDSNGAIKYIGHGWVVDGHLHRTCTYRTYEVFPLLSSIEEEPSVRRELIYEVSEEYAYLHYNWGYDGICNGFFYEGNFNLANAKNEAGGYDYDDVYNDLTGSYSFNVLIITEIRPEY